MAQYGQADSLVKGTITIHKDARIDMLGKKMAEYNESLSSKMKMVNGYRLMLLSTNDRAMAMQIRSQLLQQYSDQKVYMIFQSPYIKLKMGNYTERPEAEKCGNSYWHQRSFPVISILYRKWWKQNRTSWPIPRNSHNIYFNPSILLQNS